MNFFSKGKGRASDSLQPDANENSRTRTLSFRLAAKAFSTTDLHRSTSREGSWDKKPGLKHLDSPAASPNSLRNIAQQRDQALAKLTNLPERPAPSPQHSFLASSASSYFPPLVDAVSLPGESRSFVSASTVTQPASPLKAPADTNAAVRYTELVTRVQRFLVSELGSNSLIDEEMPQEPEQPWLAWSTYDPAGYCLWRNLRDGVLLCWLLNRFFPDSLTNIKHSDSTTIRKQNIARFLQGAQQHLFLHPDDLFTITDLSEGLPDPFSRVLHTVLAVARAVRPEEEYMPPSTIIDKPRRQAVSMGAIHDQTPSSISIDETPSGIRDRPRKHTSSSPTKHSAAGREKRSQVSFSSNEVSLEGSRKSARFYGLDRRLSDTAVNLTTVEEVPPGGELQNRRRPSLQVRPKAAPRSGSHTGLIAPRKRASDPAPEATDSGFLSCSPARPLRPNKSVYRPHLHRSSSSSSSQPEKTISELLTANRKARPLSAESFESIASSIPFPRVSKFKEREGSEDVSPNEDTVSALSATSSSRPRHKRWNSDLQPGPRSALNSSTASGRPRHESETPDADSAIGSSMLTRSESSTNGSRLKIVVREAGKTARTYQLGECIGRGQFGSVYKALHLNSGRVVAVKRIKLEGKTEEEISQLATEVEVLRSVSHPSIVRYEGLVRTEHYLNLILEVVENGSLLHTLKAFGEFPEALVASYVVKILEGLNHLHKNRIVHCDLKCANILSTKSGNIKIGDFGVSLQLNAVRNKSDVSGTPNWMAPEVIRLEGASTASDIWSLACTIVEMITGKPPYANLNSLTAMYRIVEDDSPPIPPKCSLELYDFLEMCFAKDPADRPTAEELSNHVWLKKNWDPLKDINPQDSIPFLRRISTEIRRQDLSGSYSPTLPSLDQYSTSPSSTVLHTPPGQSHERLSNDLARVVSNAASDPSSSFEHLHYDDEGRRISKVPIVGLVPVFSPLSITLSSPTPHDETPPLLPVVHHAFVKTSFSKAVQCKLCDSQIKRHGKAFLCESCGIICHSKCSHLAGDSCDLRASLLDYSQRPRLGSNPYGASNPMNAMSMPSLVPQQTLPNSPSVFQRLGIKRKAKASNSASEETQPDLHRRPSAFRTSSDLVDRSSNCDSLPKSDTSSTSASRSSQPRKHPYAADYATTNTHNQPYRRFSAGQVDSQRMSLDSKRSSRLQKPVKNNSDCVIS